MAPNVSHQEGVELFWDHPTSLFVFLTHRPVPDTKMQMWQDLNLSRFEKSLKTVMQCNGVVWRVLKRIPLSTGHKCTLQQKGWGA